MKFLSRTKLGGIVPKISKNIEYRRANWLTGNLDLEEYVRETWRLLPDQVDRTITKLDNSNITGLKSMDFGIDGFAIHCARYVNGQGVGVISMNPKHNVDLEELPPNDNENFLNSDFIVLFQKNHIASIGVVRSALILSDYLKDLFKKSLLGDDAQNFELIRVASVDAIRSIKKYKVKSIDLKVAISTATAAHFELDRKDWFGPLLGALIKRDPKVEDLRNSQNGTAKISIIVPSGDLLAVNEGLDALAMSVVNDEESEDFVINLRNGDTIKPDQMSVRKTVKLEGVADSVSVDQAWNEMRFFLQKLHEDGQIEA